MLSWFLHHPALLFYVSDEDRLARAPALRLKRMWIGLLAAGFLWGLVSVGLWHGGQWLFGQSVRLSFLPNLLVAAGIMLGLYHRATTSLVRILTGLDTARGVLSACALAMLFVGGFMAMEPGWYLQEQVLPNWLVWIRPESKIDRLLLLLPLWGAWSMLILPQFHRPTSDDAVVCAVARGCGPFTAAVIMGVLLVATIGYFAYLPWTQVTIPVVGVAAAVVGGLALAKRNGAMDRNVLLATNLLTQTAVLLAVAANGVAR